MDASKVIALLVCCCCAASATPNLPRRTRGQATHGTGSLLKPGFKVITELPQPEPGFYLNRQFQKKNVKESVKESPINAEYEPGFFLNRQFQGDNSASNDVARSEVVSATRKVVDASGRYWVVAEEAKPEPGFYLNRQFQKEKLVHSNIPKKDDNNKVFLLRNDPNTNRREIVVVKSTQEHRTSSVSQKASAKPAPAAKPNFYTVFESHGRIPAAQTQSVSFQETGNPQSASVFGAQHSEPSSFIVGQMLKNKNTAVDGASQSLQSARHQIDSQSPLEKVPETQGVGFSCDGKPFGYYADLESNCQKYHICNPVTFSGGLTQHLKYSFNCSRGSRWDPLAKVCSPISAASPCQ